MAITTVEELDALPHSAIIVDKHDCPWQKADDAVTLWLMFGSKTARTTAALVRWGPFEILSDRRLIMPRLTGVAIVGA